MIDLSLHRRRFLRIGSLALSGLGLPNILRAEENSRRPAKARSCIVFYMCGGASHIDMFDMKPAAGSEIRGPFTSIDSTVPGTRVCEHLPQLAKQMHRFLQVRSLQHQETVHPQAVYQMLTGYPQTSSIARRGVERMDDPHLASAFAQADRISAVLPKSIRLPSDTMIGGGSALISQRGQNAGRLRDVYDPFPVAISPEGVLAPPELGLASDVSVRRHADRERLLDRFNLQMRQLSSASETARFDAFQHQALNILSAPSVQDAFNLGRESPGVHDQYGRHRQGQSLLLARRLVEAGARFVTVYWGPDKQDWADGQGMRIAGNPWDTHRNHFPILEQSLFPRFDQSLSALVKDLGERGILDDTLVVWMSDFGRTPRISTRWASRDHWPGAFSIMLAGGGVRAGEVIGQTDKFAEKVIDQPVSPADLTATIFQALGVSPLQTIQAANSEQHQLSIGNVQRQWFNWS